MMYPTPSQMEATAKVAIKGWMLKTLASVEFISPTTAPTSNTRSIASGQGIPLLISSATMTPLMAAKAELERSMCPPMIRNVSPMASKPTVVAE